MINQYNTHILVADFKDSSDPSHFIYEFNVGKSRVRHTTTLKLNNEFLYRLKIDFEEGVIQIQNRYMSDLPLSEIYFKNKMALV